MDFWAMINTVLSQADKYTKRQVQRATQARRIQNICMRPPTRKLVERLLPQMNGCPLDASDFKIADDIYGPNLGLMKGKTVHCPNPHVHTRLYPVPSEILAAHPTLVLEIDIFFVNKLAFFITHTQAVHFITVEPLENQQVPTNVQCLEDTIKVYKNRGFNIGSILCDGEFTPLQPSFPSLNPCGAGKHIPGIEHTVQTVKDSMRSTYRMFPF